MLRNLKSCHFWFIHHSQQHPIKFEQVWPQLATRRRCLASPPVPDLLRPTVTVLRPAAADSHTQHGTTPELELAGGQGQGRGVSGRGVEEAQGCRGRRHVVCRAAAGVLQGLDRTAGLRGLPVAPCPWPPRMGRRLCSLQITTSIHSSRRATGDQPNYQHLTISECWSFFGISISAQSSHPPLYISVPRLSVI